MDSVSLGDIAGMIAALAFAFLVFRLGSVIGKAGKILDETRVSLRSTTENVQPTLLKLTETVSLTNEQLVRDFTEKYFNQALTAFLESQRAFERNLRNAMGIGAVAPSVPDWTKMMWGSSRPSKPSKPSNARSRKPKRPTR